LTRDTKAGGNAGFFVVAVAVPAPVNEGC
jgi:hypothetical protein